MYTFVMKTCALTARGCKGYVVSIYQPTVYKPSPFEELKKWQTYERFKEKG